MLNDPFVFVVFLFLIVFIIAAVICLFVKHPKVLVMTIFVFIILFMLVTSPTVAEEFKEEKGVIVKVAPYLSGDNPMLVVSVETQFGDIYKYYADGEIDVDKIVKLLLYGDEVLDVEIDDETMEVNNDYN